MTFLSPFPKSTHMASILATFPVCYTPITPIQLLTTSLNLNMPSLFFLRASLLAAPSARDAVPLDFHISHFTRFLLKNHLIRKVILVFYSKIVPCPQLLCKTCILSSSQHLYFSEIIIHINPYTCFVFFCPFSQLNVDIFKAWTLC